MYAVRKRSKLTVAGVAIFLIAALMVAPVQGQNKSPKKANKRICLTFDELPAAQSFTDVDREAVTYLLLETMKKHEVKAAGFVVGNQIEDSFDVLGSWLNSGHVLGNMTYSNQDLHELGIEQFIVDIQGCGDALETMLEGFGQKKRYFRYPFLHYGVDAEAKKQVKLFLDAHDYIVAHATIVIEDYLYNLSLEKMGKFPDSAQFEGLLNEYVNHVLDEIERMEMVSQTVLGRQCRQILRLKANRLNAVFLDEMLTAIKDMGYTFISLDEALQDELYEIPEAYFGARGVSYIEMIEFSDPDHIPAE